MLARFFAFLSLLWNTPSDFSRDPAGEAGNQSAHFAIGGFLAQVGLGAVLILSCLAHLFGLPRLPEILALAVPLSFAFWERSQYRWRGAKLADCLRDFGFVALGGIAFWVARDNGLFVIAFNLFLISICVGIARRV